MTHYNDDTKMPFGKFKGTKLEDTPDWWFKHFWKKNDVWYRSTQGNIYSNGSYDCMRYYVMEYIEENFEESEL